jgi:flagellar biosynthesis chaperone FliJ
MKIIQVITLSMMVTAVTVALGQEPLPATSGDRQMGTLPGSGEDRMLRLFGDFKGVASQIDEAIESLQKAGTEKKAFDKLNEGQSLVREMLSKVKVGGEFANVIQTLLEKRQAKLPSYNTDANLSPEQRRVLIEGEQEIIARLEKLKTDMSNVRVNLENLDQKLAQSRNYLELLFDQNSVKRALEKAEKSLEALKKVVTALDESIDQVVEIESHESE